MWDINKLLWVSAEHIKAKAPAELVEPLREAAERAGLSLDPAFLPHRPEGWIHHVIANLQERSQTLVEMVQRAKYALVESLDYDDGAVKKFLRPVVQIPVEDLRAEIEKLPEWPEESAIEAAFQTVLDKHELKMVKLAQPARVALTGTSASPGIYAVAHQLGRDLTLKRLDAALEMICQRAADTGT